MPVLANFVLFQAGWFACILGAAHGVPWIGALAAALIVAWHLGHAVDRTRELALLCVAALLGASFETLLLQTGWVRFDAGLLVEGAAPYWMVALWAIFATTLNVTLRALRTRLIAAAALGAIGGPVAYYAGAQLGALEFTAVGAGLAAIAVGWAVLAPALFSAARRLDGYARP